jgi:hypothetical protein
MDIYQTQRTQQRETIRMQVYNPLAPEFVSTYNPVHGQLPFDGYSDRMENLQLPAGIRRDILRTASDNPVSCWCRRRTLHACWMLAVGDAGLRESVDVQQLKPACKRYN